MYGKYVPQDTIQSSKFNNGQSIKLISHFHSNSLGLLLLQNYDRPTFVKGGERAWLRSSRQHELRPEEGRTKWTNNSSSLLPLETTSLESSLDELLVLCYCGCCCCQRLLLRPAAALAWAEAVEAAVEAAAGEIGSPTPPPKSGMLEVTSKAVEAVEAVEAVGGDGQPFVLV